MPGISPRYWTSTREVRTGRAGCPAIADASNPQAGPDATAAFQALVDGGGRIVVDQPLLVNQIRIPSGTTIEGLYEGSYRPGGAIPATGLWMKALPASGSGSSNSCVLRNANWRSNYDASDPTSSSLSVSRVVDQDIAIRNLFIDGQKRNGASGQSDPRTNADNVYLSGIQIFGCYNLTIENVFVYDPACFHFAASNVAWATFRNLRFLDPTYYAGTPTSPSLNTDGLHLVGPAQDVEVDGLYGPTGDDFLALNAAEGNLGSDVVAPGYQSSGPHVWGGWGNVYYGHILRVNARNLYPVNAEDVLRIQTGRDTTTGNPGCNVDQVQVTGVVGSIALGALASNLGSSTPQGGTKGRILLEDWHLTPIDASSTGGTFGYYLDGTWTDLAIANHRWSNFRPSPQNQHQINLLPGASIGRLEIDGYAAREDSGEAASVVSPISITQGTVDDLAISRCNWMRDGATDVAFASISGGIVNRIGISNTYCRNISNMLSVTGSAAVQNVDTVGLCHRAPDASGPAGGAAINVGAGVTVGVLTSCGSDAGALVGTSAGTVTTKKTDGTERGA